MDQSSIKALSERIAKTLPSDRARRNSVLQELKALRQRLSPQASKDRMDRLDAAVLLMEFMATVEAAVTSDALGVVARLVATIDQFDAAEPIPEPAVLPTSVVASFPAEDLRLSFSLLLGQILLEAGVLSIDDVGEGLRLQLKTRRPLGACLVELGFATENQVIHALRIQDGLGDTPPASARGQTSVQRPVQQAPVQRQPIQHPPTHAPVQRPLTPPAEAHRHLSTQERQEQANPQKPQPNEDLVPAFSDEPLPEYSAPPQAQRPRTLQELTLENDSREYLNCAMNFLLGEILVRQGSIQRKELNRALSVQRASGRFLGETLVEIGAATWDQVKIGLRLQKQLR